MLKRVKIENFKSIKDLELELAPLTILVGANGTGKSSVLEALMLLRQSLERDIRDPNSLTRPFIDLGRFADIVHKRDESKYVGIEIYVKPSEYDLSRLQTLYEAIPEQSNLNKISEAGYKLEFRNGEVKQTIFADGKPFLSVGVAKADAGYRSIILYPEKLKKDFNPHPSPIYVLHPDAFTIGPQRADVREKAESISNFSSKVAEVVKNEISRTYYISALRGDVKRSVSTGSSPEWVGVRGEYTLELLALIAGKREYEERWRKIAKWGEELGVAELHAGWWGGNQLGADYKDPELGAVLNVASAGYGSRQTLPLIVQLFFSPKGSLIMLEEPEISLHPNAQIKLPWMFLDALRDGQQIIVTTHSESLLLALKTLIGKGELKAEEAAIHHFSKTGEGVAAKRLELTPDGIIRGWVPSFAEAELKLLKDWMEKPLEARED